MPRKRRDRDMLLGFDTETTGVNTISSRTRGNVPDQPYQLAIIIYDDDLKEVERHNYFFRPKSAREIYKKEIESAGGADRWMEHAPEDMLRHFHLLDANGEYHPENLDRPQPMSFMASQVNHYTDEDLEKLKPFDEYGEEIVSLFEKHRGNIMAYNADFDVDQMIYEASLCRDDWCRRLIDTFFTNGDMILLPNRNSPLITSSGQVLYPYDGAKGWGNHKRYRDAMYELQDLLGTPATLKLDQGLEVLNVAWDDFTDSEKSLLKEYSIGEEQTHDAFDDVRQMVGEVVAFGMLRKKGLVPDLEDVTVALRNQYRIKSADLRKKEAEIDAMDPSDEKAKAYGASTEMKNGLRFRVGTKIEHFEEIICSKRIAALEKEASRPENLTNDEIETLIEALTPLAKKIAGEKLVVTDGREKRNITYPELFGLNGDGDGMILQGSSIRKPSETDVELRTNSVTIDALIDAMEERAAKHPSASWARRIMNEKQTRHLDAVAVMEGAKGDMNQVVSLPTKYMVSGTTGRRTHGYAGGKNVTWQTAVNNYKKLAGASRISIIQKKAVTAKSRLNVNDTYIRKPEWDMQVTNQVISDVRRYMNDEWGLPRSNSEIRGYMKTYSKDVSASWQIDMAKEEIKREKKKDEKSRS